MKRRMAWKPNFTYWLITIKWGKKSVRVIFANKGHRNEQADWLYTLAKVAYGEENVKKEEIEAVPQIPKAEGRLAATIISQLTNMHENAREKEQTGPARPDAAHQQAKEILGGIIQEFAPEFIHDFELGEDL